MPQRTNWRLANFSRARSLWQQSLKPHSMGAEEYRSRWGARPSKPSRRDYVSGGFDSYLFRQLYLKINGLISFVDFTPIKPPESFCLYGQLVRFFLVAFRC